LSDQPVNFSTSTVENWKLVHGRLGMPIVVDSILLKTERNNH